jgi:hypothetical protein
MTLPEQCRCCLSPVSRLALGKALKTKRNYR